jgi:inhibitor of cysteine peptidase
MAQLHSVSETDNGRTLQARVGDVIYVRLAENPTTGYRWIVLPGAESVLPLRNDDFQQDVSGGIGSGGVRSFRFEVIDLGTAQLELVLRPEWEPASSAQKQYRLTVVVSV